MKGLMLKDMILLRDQKRTFFLLVVCGIVMSISLQPTTAASYLTIVGTLMIMSTISYDEYENGFSFLFTLPVSRETYVREKYLLSLIWTFCSMLFGTLLSVLLILFTKQGEFGAYMGGDMLPTIGTILAVSFLFLAVMIPIRIKYGSEKGKIIYSIAFAVLAVFAIGISKADSFFGAGAEEWLMGVVRRWNDLTLLAVFLLVSLILLLISEQVSERIIKKKEY